MLTHAQVNLNPL